MEFLKWVLPVHAAIAQGEIYKTTNGSSAWPNFFFDETGKPVIGAVNFQKVLQRLTEKLLL